MNEIKIAGFHGLQSCSAFWATVSLALAIAVANTLLRLYVADHLSKGNVVLPPDYTSLDEDSDEDALAL